MRKERKMKFTAYTRTSGDWEESESTYLQPITAKNEDEALEAFIADCAGDFRAVGAKRTDKNVFQYEGSDGNPISLEIQMREVIEQ